MLNWKNMVLSILVHIMNLFQSHLSSAIGQNSSDIKAGRPGMRGMMVVSRAIIVEPAAFNPTNPAIIILVCGDSGSSSMATEFTLSGSTLAALQVTTVLVHCLMYKLSNTDISQKNKFT